MRRCTKEILIAVLAIAAASHAARADINWLNTTNGRITYASGGTNYLSGSLSDSNGSCFVQLIFAGANKTNDTAVNSGSGVTNDDVVVMTSWMGKNPGSQQGICNAGTYTVGGTGGFYFVRAWSAPALDYANGLVPTAPTNHYGDSRLYSNQNCVICFPIDFDFGGTGGFSTALAPGITDTDSDGLPDWWESAFFSNPTSASAAVDAEGDGHNNFAEFVSGTDPTNSASVFEVEVFSGVVDGAPVIQWSSVTNKLYEVRRYTNLAGGFTVQATNLPGNPPLNGFTDTVTGVEVYFYGVGVK